MRLLLSTLALVSFTNVVLSSPPTTLYSRQLNIPPDCQPACSPVTPLLSEVRTNRRDIRPFLTAPIREIARQTNAALNNLSRAYETVFSALEPIKAYKITANRKEPSTVRLFVD